MDARASLKSQNSAYVDWQADWLAGWPAGRRASSFLIQKDGDKLSVSFVGKLAQTNSLNGYKLSRSPTLSLAS